MTPDSPSGAFVRLVRAEQDIQKLDLEKADVKDVQALTKAFDSLRNTLQWFMGIMALFAISSAVAIIQLVQ